MGQTLPVASWLELTGGIILTPTIGSLGIPTRGDLFSSPQLSTWGAEAKYVVTIDLNEYLDLNLGLGYRFIPAITAMLPSLGGAGSSEAVSIALGSIRASAAVVFYF